MLFITQGKTNWKFLLVVIILAIIVGGGALWYATRPERPYQPVEIKKQENKGEISVDYPKEGQRFLASENVSVCWEPYDAGSSVKLALYTKGDSSNPTKIFEENIITPEMPYDNFKLPENLDTKNTYQIFVGSDKGSGFSGPFTIIGEDNWQTYTNEEYGYEFKYPLSVEKDYLIMKSFFNIEATTSDPGYENCRFIQPGSQMEVAGQKIKINNIDFCVMGGEEHGAGTVAYARIYVAKKDNKYFKIDASGEGASAGTCLCNCNPYFGSDLFSKMLSTFKFIEEGEMPGELLIRVGFPNGGEQLVLGQTYTIKWISNSNASLHVNILLDGYDQTGNKIEHKNFDEQSSGYIASRIENTHSYQWTPTAQFLSYFVSTPAKYKIRITPAGGTLGFGENYPENYPGKSADYFTIIPSK